MDDQSAGPLDRAGRAAAAIELLVVDPESQPAQFCLGEYFAELDRRFTVGFDGARALPTDPEAMRPPRGLFVVATSGAEPVGCGALKLTPGRPAELKRVWVSPTARGLGLGRRLVRDLEQRARQLGSRSIRLDSNASLTEAIALYRGLGYHEVAPFNDEPYADFWFEKSLTDQGCPGPTPALP